MYKLKNIQLQYETICSKTLADEATSVYSSGKAFAYDYVLREEVVTFAKKTDSTLNIRVNSQRRSLNGILMLFVEPYAAGARYSEKCVNLDIKVSVIMKGSPNNVYNNGFEGHDMWKEISRFFSLEKGTSNMDHTKFYTDNKFKLPIDLRSMTDTKMRGSGIRLVNTKDSVFLEIERKTSGSGNLKCHVFTISDPKLKIMDRQFHSVQ